ncbi:MAG: putative quinol monooxygenase [Novosphingobium sp.]
MILVAGTFRLPLESWVAGREALIRVIEATRAEPGCADYAYAEDVLEPGLFRVSEVWASREALAVHFETPHMKQWQREREALGMTDREMRAFTVSGKEVL